METPKKTTNDTNIVGDILGVVADKQTYKNLLYLLLAFPLGLFYYTFLTIGLTVGAVLTIVAVGVGIVFLTVLCARVVAEFERKLANALLDTEIRAPADIEDVTGKWAKARAYIEAESTWRSLGYLAVKFWVGIFGFVLVVVLLGSAIELLTAPLDSTIVFGTVNSQEIAWSVDTVPEMLLAVPLGAVLAILSLHVINGFAYVTARIAEGLLGETTDSPPAQR